MPAFGGMAVALEESGLTTPSAVLVGVVLTGVTVPLLRWVLGRLDKSLAQQAKVNDRQARTEKAILGLLGVLIKEQREKRAENQEHHRMAMEALLNLQQALQEAEEDDEQPPLPGETPPRTG
jgi:uncharacterized coiled-coil protein SlyX